MSFGIQVCQQFVMLNESACFVCVTISPLLHQDHIPFGVVGSKEEIIAGGKRIRARQYPWGLVEGQLCCYHNDMNMINYHHISIHRC